MIHANRQSTPIWSRTRTWTLGESRAVPYTIRAYSSYSLNLLERADDWIRTSINPFTRRVPFYVEPRRRITVTLL